MSHEYFHAFNVKRLRPVELGPFDYEHPPTTSSLWIAEGLTTYFGDLIVVRSGLGTTQDFLKAMSSDIEQLQNSPGRLVQSLEQSSLDVWSSGTSGVGRNRDKTVNYYVKGPIVGFLLDARIQHATEGKKSLDDVMRQAYKRYGGERGFTADEFRMTARGDRRSRSQRVVPQEHRIDGRAGLPGSTRLVRPAIRPASRRRPGEERQTGEEMGARNPRGFVRISESSPGKLIVTRTRNPLTEPRSMRNGFSSLTPSSPPFAPEWPI